MAGTAAPVPSDTDVVLKYQFDIDCKRANPGKRDLSTWPRSSTRVASGNSSSTTKTISGSNWSWSFRSAGTAAKFSTCSRTGENSKNHKGNITANTASTVVRSDQRV